jgi:lipooligosaccharide transport system permease protein
VCSYGYPEAPLLTVVHILFLLALTVAGWTLTKRQFITRMGS